MKKNFNKMPDKKGYLAMVFTCVAVVAVFAGVGAGSLRMGEDKEVPQYNVSDNVLGDEVVDIQPVTSNQNAPNKPEEVKPQESTQAPEPENNKPDGAKPEESTTAKPVEDEGENKDNSDDPEYEATSTMGNDFHMMWPVEGEVVMEFSTDRVVYDRTLDQYRTNDSVSIGVEEGSDVFAAQVGTIESVTFDNVNGNTVVINHNNGWTTTYSQLKENIAVKEGDTIEKGAKIGEVGAPTIYGSALGSHLDFKVTRDDLAVNPSVALSE